MMTLLLPRFGNWVFAFPLFPPLSPPSPQPPSRSAPFYPGRLFLEVWFNLFISLVSPLFPLSKFSGKTLIKIID